VGKVRYSLILLMFLAPGCTGVGDVLLDCCSGGFDGADTGLVCDNCAMMITKDMLKFSAYAKPVNKAEVSFCSICCMLRYKEENSDAQGHVLDYNTFQWVNAEEAYFVKGDVKAPMGCKLIAFENHDSALEYKRAHKGEVLGFNDIY
jgi:nitrous oxide reductase accessory protein NosL